MSNGTGITLEKGGRKGLFWGLAALIAAAAFAAYANSFSVPFLLDDEASIVQNPTIHHLGDLRAVFAPPAGSTVSGRPLLNLSFALNEAISGPALWSYHLLNLVVHVLAGLALFSIVRRTLGFLARSPSAGAQAIAPAATGIAFGAAMIWTLHPLQTEAVTYVVQRAESMMGLFYLWTLYGFIRGLETRKWLWFSWTACLLGAATKEVMVTAPVMILAYDRTFVSGTFKEAWKLRKGYYLGLAVTWILLVGLVASTGGNRSGTSGFGTGVSWGAYWLTQSKAILHYLRLAAWPSPLVFEYGTFWMPNVGAAMPSLIGVAVLGASALYLFLRPVEKSGLLGSCLGFCGFWFFGILSVTSFVPGIYQMIVEHRMYLPLAVLSVLAAVGLRKLLGRGGLWACLAISLALGCATFARNSDYRSSVSLWQDTVDKRPGNETAQTSLGIALFDEGRAKEAIPHFEAALKIKPDSPDTLNDLGCALVSLGRAPEGIVPLERVVRIDPSVPQYHFNLGNALETAGRYEEAIAELKQALRGEPGHVEAHLKLGVALYMTGRVDEAMAERAEGLRLQGKAP